MGGSLLAGLVAGPWVSGAGILLASRALGKELPKGQDLLGADQEALVAAVTGAEVTIDGLPSQHRLGKLRPMAKHAAYWADKVRERFGVVANKAADLAAVRRWMADEMQKDEHHPWKDMRIKDRVALQTLVTYLAVVPTAFEVEAERMARGALAQDLLRLFQTTPK